MATPKSLTAKKAAQAELHQVKTITVTLTLEASESVLQRLSALMLLQDPTKVIPEIADLGPMPFDPQPAEKTKPLEMDWNAVRNDIIKWLSVYVATFDRDAASSMLRWHGGESLSLIPEENLLDLLADLEDGCTPNDENRTRSPRPKPA